MSMDVVADFCTSIRNAVAVKKRVVDVPYSKLKEKVAGVMKDEGFLKDFVVVKLDSCKKILRVFPRYIEGNSAIVEIKSISTCGSRYYIKGDALWPLKNGFAIRILSTNKGVMSDRKIRKLQDDQGKRVCLGGEVICSVW